MVELTEETDNKENRNKLWIKEDVQTLSKEEIPCRRCGKTDLETVEDTNGNDCLRCQDCGRYVHHVIAELHEQQKVKANIENLHEAVISKRCGKCRENLEYSGRTAWKRFSNRNQWSCPNGCTRDLELRDSVTVKIKEGKASISIYDIVPSKSVPVKRTKNEY